MGADLFAAEDGLGVDLDMDWMAGLPQDQSISVSAGPSELPSGISIPMGEVEA